MNTHGGLGVFRARNAYQEGLTGRRKRTRFRSEEQARRILSLEVLKRLSRTLEGAFSRRFFLLPPDWDQLAYCLHFAIGSEQNPHFSEHYHSLESVKRPAT